MRLPVGRCHRLPDDLDGEGSPHRGAAVRSPGGRRTDDRLAWATWVRQPRTMPPPVCRRATCTASSSRVSRESEFEGDHGQQAPGRGAAGRPAGGRDRPHPGGVRTVPGAWPRWNARDRSGTARPGPTSPGWDQEMRNWAAMTVPIPGWSSSTGQMAITSCSTPVSYSLASAPNARARRAVPHGRPRMTALVRTVVTSGTAEQGERPPCAMDLPPPCRTRARKNPRGIPGCARLTCEVRTSSCRRPRPAHRCAPARPAHRVRRASEPSVCRAREPGHAER